MCRDFQKEGWDAATEHYKKTIDAKDKEIERLKAQLALLSKSPAISPQKYAYNAAHFPKQNGDTIIEALIALDHCKREKGKYIISTKTDWYMVWKVLHYFKLYIGSEYDFIDIVNDCVLPNIKDSERRTSLKVSSCNFKSIKANDPMKDVSVAKWRTKLEKQLEEQQNKMHGTLSLDRGINILVNLQHLLKQREVESYNYER